MGASAESDVENNAGAVFVYLGQSTGGFSESVDIRLDSAYSSDRLGFSLASCDLNGDGYDDLIAGAYGAEDRSVDEVENGQGGLFLYLGNPAGLSETPSGYRWGVLLDETDTWKYADVGIGRTIGAADLNGDGLCDVIIGNELHNWGRDSEDGTQMVYFGSATQADGLDTLPGRVFEMGADHGKGRLGEKMAFGDFDGDGADDVALGARLATNDNDDTYPGMVLVFLAQSMEGIPATQALTPDDADWVVIGDNSYDYVGRGLNVADVTGDGLADLLVSAPYGESDESENNVGLVSVYSGEAIAEMSDASASPYDASTDPPVLQWVGAIKSASLGIGLDAIGDLDGDGLSDLLAHATCDPTYGSCGGAPYWLKTTDLSLHLLDFAHKTAGHGYGEAGTLLFYDVDADGLDDLLVGGPGVGEFDTQPNVGVVLAYAGQSDALSNAAVTLPLTHPQVSTNSTMGHHLSSAGDFNQDGWADLVVVSKDESKPSSFGSDYINPDECASGSLYSAGAAAIHLGSSAGISEEPAFLVFGPLESDDIRTVIGDLDLNGDGWDDVVIGSDLWASSSGGVGVLYGQAEDSGGITILCDPLLLYGEDTSIEVGRALASLGDIDGDGCDDVAIGVAEDDLLDNDEGSVRILWGWGGAGCHATPELSGFTLDANEAEIGAALASGWDADKDGVNDLWVGAPGYNGSGAVWRISGATLTGLARSPVAGGILSSEAVTVFESDSLAGVERLDGSTLNSRFGESIAVLPDRGLLAIGSPMGDLGGLSGSGGVELFRFAADTSTWSTAAIVAGETHQPGGRLGTSIVAKDLIHSHLLVVGAPEIDGNGVDHGGVYVFELPTGL